MKKILLLGLKTDPNLGDGLIAECTRRLTDKALCELGCADRFRVETSDIRGLDFRRHLAEHNVIADGINTIKLPKKRGLGELAARGWCRVFPESKAAKRRRETREKLRSELREKAGEKFKEYSARREKRLSIAAAENASAVVFE